MACRRYLSPAKAAALTSFLYAWVCISFPSTPCVPATPTAPTTNEPWSLHDQGSHKTIVAVAAGFEPAVAINHTAFRVLHLRPLGHATADYRSGITPHSATRQPVGRDTSPGCTSITEPMPGSTRPKHAPSRRAAHSPHDADVAPVFRISPRRRPPAYAEPSRKQTDANACRNADRT